MGQIEALEAQLELLRTEKKLTVAKKDKKMSDVKLRELKAQVRAARQEYREKYRSAVPVDGVAVQPDTVRAVGGVAGVG